MKTSLLIPAFRSATTLPRLLEQAHRQTLPFSEILVYDDASDDPTATIAEAGGARVLRGSVNHGPSVARNTLLAAAAGDFIHFHDADDEMAPTLHAALAALSAPHRIVFGDYSVAESGSEERRLVHYSPPPPPADWVDFFLRYHVPLDVMLVPRALLMPSAFSTDLRQAEDRLLNIQLAQAGVEFVHASHVVAHVNTHPHSSSRQAGIRSHCLHEMQLYRRLAPLLSARHRTLMGNLLLGPACALVIGGHDAEARDALDLARHLGANQYPGGSLLTRSLVRILGPGPTFRLMRWKLQKLPRW
ncbi:glycosyltransferase [Opitutaceae bacterium TAV4]|nr:glycosyltransferase [Opitutaceae bacterium TAV4]RRK00724.1 glycosyltransferase [Opitutaceae bacterium TAV3]